MARTRKITRQPPKECCILRLPTELLREVLKLVIRPSSKKSAGILRTCSTFRSVGSDLLYRVVGPKTIRGFTAINAVVVKALEMGGQPFLGLVLQKCLESVKEWKFSAKAVPHWSSSFTLSTFKALQAIHFTQDCSSKLTWSAAAQTLLLTSPATKLYLKALPHGLRDMHLSPNDLHKFLSKVIQLEVSTHFFTHLPGSLEDLVPQLNAIHVVPTRSCPRRSWDSAGDLFVKGKWKEFVEFLPPSVRIVRFIVGDESLKVRLKELALEVPFGDGMEVTYEVKV